MLKRCPILETINFEFVLVLTRILLFRLLFESDFFTFKILGMAIIRFVMLL